MAKKSTSRRVTREEVLNPLTEGDKTPAEIRVALGLRNSDPIRQHLRRAAADREVKPLPNGRYHLLPLGWRRLGVDNDGEDEAELDDELDWISEERTLRPRGRKVKQADSENAEPQSHPRTEPRGLTVRTDSEECWPAEKLFSLVTDNFALGWRDATGQHPTPEVLNRGVREFLASHKVPPVFPKGQRVSAKNVSALLAGAYQDGAGCGEAYIAELKRERRSPEFIALQRENAALRGENRQLRILAEQMRETAEQYKTCWLEAKRQAARERVVLQQQITKLQGELKRLHADKGRRELCSLLERVAAALEQERAAHQETKRRWLSAEDRAYEAEHGLLTGGQIEQILWRELNIQLAWSIMNALR